MSIPLVTTAGSGVAIEVRDMPTDKTTAALSTLRAFVDHHARPDEPMSLVSVTAGPALSSGVEIRGYYATYKPDATMMSDVIHTKYGYGQLMAIDVDPPASGDLGAVKEALAWAGTAAPLGDPLESPEVVLGTGTDLQDAKPWLARLSGVGSFVGVFQAGNKALLVVYCTAPPNQLANKQAIAKQTRSYREHVGDPLQQKVRRRQQRNCMRILHDAAVAMGAQAAAERGVLEDIAAVAAEGPIAGADGRHAALAMLRKKPMLTVPRIHNEMDLMLVAPTSGLVEHYDGLVAVGIATGGLFTFENGRAAQGIRVCSLTSERFWDGGYTGVTDWKTPESVARAASVLYVPVALVTLE